MDSNNFNYLKVNKENKITKLELDLGLVSNVTAEMKVIANPSAQMLKEVPKSSQTFELVRFVCEKDGLAIEYVSKKLLNDELFQVAVSQNGLALQFVQEEKRTASLCEIAVSQNGLAFEYVPKKLISQKLVDLALDYVVKDSIRGTFPIAHIPKRYINDERLIKSVTNAPFSLRDINKAYLTKELFFCAVKANGLTLRYVPQDYITKELVDIALSRNPLSILYAPEKFKTKGRCLNCFSKNPLVMISIPDEYITKNMCIEVIKGENFELRHTCYKLLDRESVLFDDIPEIFRNDHEIIDLLCEKYGPQRIINWNNSIIEDWDGIADIENGEENVGPTNLKDIVINPLCNEVVEYINKIILRDSYNIDYSFIDDEITNIYTDTPEFVEINVLTNNQSNIPVVYEGENLILHDLVSEDKMEEIYYVSDIHVEHQLYKKVNDILDDEIESIISCVKEEFANESSETIETIIEWKKLERKHSILIQLLRYRVREMVSSADDNSKMLLVAGDVADDIKISYLFYRVLRREWQGEIIVTLGNHELWDGSLGSLDEQVFRNVRSPEEIVENYREMFSKFYEINFIENEVFIVYKNSEKKKISEKIIMDADEKDLKSILDCCTIIILGGIGYSGLSSRYNANCGLYRNTITSLDEDIKRSKQFFELYKKIDRCAHDKKVIVMTHCPVDNWMNEKCNPNWIYVNGHTHNNTIINEKNVKTIFSDNQIGYKPKKWRLSAFTMRTWYDPFEKYEDGIYQITSQEYAQFNKGRGISSNGCSYEGKLYALKKCGMYMFILQTKNSTCLMVGGQRKKLEIDNINYYFENMYEYGVKIKEAIRPYQNVLERISAEVKKFGGTGIIHGCIVDISWFSHIYVNPFDGKITSYWALNTMLRLTFESLEDHLMEKEPELLNRYLETKENHQLLLLSSENFEVCEDEIATVPQWMFGNDIYVPSRMLRTVQYAYCQNVIRIWNINFAKKLIGEVDSKYYVEKNLSPYNMVQKHWKNLLEIPEEKITRNIVEIALKGNSKYIFPYLDYERHYKINYPGNVASDSIIAQFVAIVASYRDTGLFERLLDCLGYDLIKYYPVEYIDLTIIKKYYGGSRQKELINNIEHLADLLEREDTFKYFNTVFRNYPIETIKQLDKIPPKYHTEKLCKQLAKGLTQKNRPQWCPKEVWMYKEK